MGQMLIRDVDDSVIKKLKRRARRRRRSLQAEVREILERAAALDVTSGRALVRKLRAQFAGRVFSDSTKLIREDRDA